MKFAADLINFLGSEAQVGKVNNIAVLFVVFVGK